MDVQIYHNPRCSKSRKTLALLREHGIEPEIIEYLDVTPNVAELRDILGKLGFQSANQLMRKGEAIYKELELKTVDDERGLLTAMVAHPKLIERPIVIKGDKAVLGRPPEAVLEIL